MVNPLDRFDMADGELCCNDCSVFFNVRWWTLPDIIEFAQRHVEVMHSD